jgi:hypothetical protein
MDGLLAPPTETGADNNVSRDDNWELAIQRLPPGGVVTPLGDDWCVMRERLAIWRAGVSAPFLYHGGGSHDRSVLQAIGRGSAVAVGVADYVTLDCEGAHDWDPTAGSQRLRERQISYRCDFAQQQAWSAWFRAASEPEREIARTLGYDWTLGKAALAETAEWLAETNHEPAA